MRLLGFILGFAAAVALEYVILSAMGVVPRGIGWVALPVMAGIAVSRATPNLVAKLTNDSAERARFKLSFVIRLAIAGASLWAVSVPAYVFLFDPYGSYMTSDDYSHMLKVVLFPLAVMGIGSFVYHRFVLGDSAKQIEIPQADSPYEKPFAASSPIDNPVDTSSRSGPPPDDEEGLMHYYGITREREQYAYGSYNFDQLKHAIAHARHVESLSERV